MVNGDDTMTSQYRCETCNFCETKRLVDFVNCNKKKLVVRYNDDCASHSDFQSERERVLGEVLKKSHITTNTDFFGGKEVVLVSDIEELREGKDGEGK